MVYFFGISLQIFKTMSVNSAWCVREMLLTHRHIFLKNKLLMRALRAGVFFAARRGCEADRTRWCLNIVAGKYSRPVGICRLIYSTHQSYLVPPSFPEVTLRLQYYCMCVSVCAAVQREVLLLWRTPREQHHQQNAVFGGRIPLGQAEVQLWQPGTGLSLTRTHFLHTNKHVCSLIFGWSMWCNVLLSNESINDLKMTYRHVVKMFKYKSIFVGS